MRIKTVFFIVLFTMTLFVSCFAAGKLAAVSIMEYCLYRKTRHNWIVAQCSIVDRSSRFYDVY